MKAKSFTIIDGDLYKRAVWKTVAVHPHPPWS
jgi:hypothetical protein